MARNKGKVTTVNNYQIKLAEAIDPRVTVSTKAELFLQNTWPNDGGAPYLYNGLIVGVVNEQAAYMLVNRDNYNSEAGWKRIDGSQGGTSGGSGEIIDNTFIIEDMTVSDIIGVTPDTSLQCDCRLLADAIDSYKAIYIRFDVENGLGTNGTGLIPCVGYREDVYYVSFNLGDYVYGFSFEREQQEILASDIWHEVISGSSENQSGCKVSIIQDFTTTEVDQAYSNEGIIEGVDTLSIAESIANSELLCIHYDTQKQGIIPCNAYYKDAYYISFIADDRIFKLVFENATDNQVRVYSINSVHSGGEGGECSTPDWNASELQDGYIKNRTHYLEDLITTKVNIPVSWGTAEFNYGGVLPEDWFIINGDYIELQKDLLLDVEDDDVYSFIDENGYKIQYANSFDNLGENHYSIKGDTAYFIYIHDNDSYSNGLYFRADIFLEQVIKLKYLGVKQIDEKFIPDTIARKSDLENIGGGGSDNMYVIPDLFIDDIFYADEIIKCNVSDIISAIDANKQIYIRSGDYAPGLTPCNVYRDDYHYISFVYDEMLFRLEIAPGNNYVGILKKLNLGPVASQSDWNASDENDPSYIKNKTHYKGTPIEMNSFEETLYFDDSVREVGVSGYKYFKIIIDGDDTTIINFADKEWPSYDYDNDIQNEYNYSIHYETDVLLKVSFYQDGGGDRYIKLDYTPLDPGARDSFNVTVIECDIPFKALSEEFIPNTIARTSALQNKQDILIDGENIKTINNKSILGKGDIKVAISAILDFTVEDVYRAHQENTGLSEIDTISIVTYIDNKEQIYIHYDEQKQGIIPCGTYRGDESDYYILFIADNNVFKLRIEDSDSTVYIDSIINLEDIKDKQNIINDLDTIRSGAGKGATAVQPSTLTNYATIKFVGDAIQTAIINELNSDF